MPVRSGVGAIGRCPLAALVMLFEFEIAMDNGDAQPETQTGFPIPRTQLA
jgi:hypothetical protein